MSFRKTRVCWDGFDDVFECWTDDARWNGWLVCHFEPCEMLRVLAALQRERFVDKNASVTAEGLAFRWLDQDQDDTVIAETIRTPVGKRLVYTTHGWTWNEATTLCIVCGDECLPATQLDALDSAPENFVCDDCAEPEEPCVGRAYQPEQNDGA